MTPTTAIGAGPMPASASGPDLGALASQNLFEHMARTSGSTLQAVTPAELGGDLMSKLEGTIERIQNFTDRVGGDAGAPSSIADGEGMRSEEASGLGDSEYERMIASFGAMFDHAVEARLISSSASQVSGACKTLLRGQ
ncbi:hypothetical protein [Halomonas maura]|uniref:hypothetical protein n=1 Tax=Halomonas maura TaxID=117606 RepID=UPI0025B3415C|nr:hypothetical protein [Halomonas maura]MDN3556901.1 hypothetical protein [Halomonas maura]